MSTSRIRGSYNVGRLRISIVREGPDQYPSGRVETPAAAADGRQHRAEAPPHHLDDHRGGGRGPRRGAVAGKKKATKK